MSRARHVLILFWILLAPVTTQARDASGLTELFSRDGILSTTLVAAPGKIQVGNLELDGLTFNGIYAGPVFHLHPGDVLRIHLVNRLQEPTNLHFHGMRGSPLGNGDNPHLLVQPGDSFDYEIIIPPSQPIGLYWYHTHAHGFVEHQIMGGLTGTIIIEGFDQPKEVQRLFVLKDQVFDDETGNDDIDDRLHGIVQSVNGRLSTRETMQPGETQMWRFTNQSANRVLHVAMKDHQFRVVGADGEPSARENAVSVLDLPPGSRLDVDVDAGAAGDYPLVVKGVMTGVGSDRQPDRKIGTLQVAGEQMSPRDSRPAPVLPPDLRLAHLDMERTVVFTQTAARRDGSQDFLINDKLFVADRMDVRVKLGNVEEWTVRNDTDDIHVFHIHQIGFQVVEINGKPVRFTGYNDNVQIPERGQVKIRMPFTDPLIVGRFMFHCHILRHEDHGMMANIEIYDPAPPTVAVRVQNLYRRVIWWWHGVPWSLCGLADA